MRTLDKSGSVWGTMTPLKGKSWVYERIFLKSDDSSDISCMFMSWEDNPFLQPSEIKKMQGVLSCDALESRQHGRFMDGTGLVFTEFDDENVIDPFEIPQAWFRMVSIDPGFTNPCAVLWIAVDPDESVYVIADYSVAEQTVEVHSREIKRISERLGFENRAIIDSAALARTLGSAESVVEQFERHGIKIDTKVNKEVFGGIMRVKALFKNANSVRKLFVFRNCIHLIKELRTYWWGQNEKPVKKNDHCIDALRYFVSTLYENANYRDTVQARIQSRAKPSVLTNNKRKLIRESRIV